MKKIVNLASEKLKKDNHAPCYDHTQGGQIHRVTDFVEFHVFPIIAATLHEKCTYSEFFWYGVSLRIQSECSKTRTRKTPNTDTFHAVLVMNNNQHL